MDKIEFVRIGILHSPLKKDHNVPHQTKYSDVEGSIEIYEKYSEGLKDLEEYEYIICISYLHLIKGPISLLSSSSRDNKMHGIFTIRTPRRPNPIGFSVLKLLERKNNILKVKNLDLIDQTPILDIKPFIPRIDNRETEKAGEIKRK
ncbi:MAG: tRNA (N6-threonylcarbamoyladenosine(37)-N6)-methyltransferase TrmO [Promethearchaeati archaeon]